MRATPPYAFTAGGLPVTPQVIGTPPGHRYHPRVEQIDRPVDGGERELAPVRVNAVSPGVIDTPWWSFLPDDQRQIQFDAAAASVPAGRIGRPEDVAEAVHYAIGATYVTGTILPVDGGFVGS